MTTMTLSPWPKVRFFDNNGAPLVNGKLFVYSAGTTTKTTSYTDSTGGTPNANPVILNARGEANVWLPPNVTFKFTLAPANDTDPPTNAIWSVDQINNSQLITLYGGVDTGIANAYVLNFTANFAALTDGIVIFWIPSNTNTLPSTINVNGLGVVNILNANGTALSAGQIQANQPVAIIYRTGGFTLFLPPVGIAQRIYKTANTSRTNTTALIADPHLIIPSGTGTFAVEALLMFNETTAGAGGIQFGLYDTGGASLSFNPKMLVQGTVNGAAYVGKAAWNIAAATISLSIANVSVVGDNDAVMFRGVLVGNGNGNVGISWAQNAATANPTNLLAGSWLQITQLG